MNVDYYIGVNMSVKKDTKDIEEAYKSLTDKPIEELNQEERIKIARKLVDMGFPVPKVSSLLHVSGRSLGKKKVEKITKTRKPETTVIGEVEKKVIEEAREKIKNVLEVGDSTLEFFDERAKRYGYDSIDEFLKMLYDFWETYKDEVERLREENRLLYNALHKLIEYSKPELVANIKAIQQMKILETQIMAKIIEKLTKDLLYEEKEVKGL